MGEGSEGAARQASEGPEEAEEAGPEEAEGAGPEEAEPLSIRIGRGDGGLGNPFSMEGESPAVRNAVCDLHAQWLSDGATQAGGMVLPRGVFVAARDRTRRGAEAQAVLAAISRAEGPRKRRVRFVCPNRGCQGGLRCHGATLAALWGDMRRRAAAGEGADRPAPEASIEAEAEAAEATEGPARAAADREAAATGGRERRGEGWGGGGERRRGAERGQGEVGRGWGGDVRWGRTAEVGWASPLPLWLHIHSPTLNLPPPSPLPHCAFARPHTHYLPPLIVTRQVLWANDSRINDESRMNPE